MSQSLFELVNPFVPNPALNQPQDNFIQKGIENGISSGIEKGMRKVSDNLFHVGQIKAQSFAENLPELATLALISYFIYLGYKVFIKHDSIELSKVYPITMIYIIFKLVWKVILHI